MILPLLMFGVICILPQESFNSSQSIGSRLDKFLISRDLLSPGIECHISLVRFPIMISFLLFLTSPLGSNKYFSFER